jgi:two-component system, cell cycle sensor histidine kinase and response regulator CckA
MERNRSILEFSALSTVLLAHDLQNLLSIMAGCVDSLAQRTHVSYADRDFAELTEAIDSGFQLSRELLAAAGLQQPAEPPVIDVHELLARYMGMLQRLVGEKVRFVMSTDASPALVEATPAQLEWILLNLAANARDAILPDGGVVHLETVRLARWSGQREGPVHGERYLRLTMRDEGSGISDEVKHDVFEPFFTTKEAGTGLGLTSVAVTVRALRGWLYVESPQSGTSVHVLLPLYLEKRETPDAPETLG